MYIFLGVSLTMLAWGWWATSVNIFYTSVIMTIICMLILDINSMINKNGFFDTAVRIMPKTDCCLVHRIWSEATSVKWATVIFRIIAAFIAVAATIVSWSDREKFLNGHYSLISAMWSAASVLWIFSCMPMFLCLIQCAASNNFKHLSSAKISENEIILRFRKVYTVWLLHDITLGIFWLYLSLMLFDTSDDENDSEWRTIFLSMIFWHILIVAFHELYLKHLYSLEPLRKPIKRPTPCCDPKHGKVIWSALSILTFIGMYIVIIERIQRESLLNMGTDSVLSPILFTCFQVLFVVSKMYTQPISHASEQIAFLDKPKDKDNGTSLLF